MGAPRRSRGLRLRCRLTLRLRFARCGLVRGSGSTRGGTGGALGRVLGYAAQKLLHVERLSERHHRAELAKLGAQCVHVLGGGDDDDGWLAFGIHLRPGAKELHAVGTGQKEMEQDEVDRSGGVLQDPEALLGVRCEGDLVAAAAEDRLEQPARVFVVLDDQDVLALLVFHRGQSARLVKQARGGARQAGSYTLFSGSSFTTRPWPPSTASTSCQPASSISRSHSAKSRSMSEASVSVSASSATHRTQSDSSRPDSRSPFFRIGRGLRLHHAF